MAIKECDHCDMCHNTGIPILLTRYAVALTEANAPRPTGNFRVPGEVPLGKAVQHTQRLLRSGYVYQYAEATDSWTVNVIQKDSCIMPRAILPDGPKPLADSTEPARQASCNPIKNGMVAGCVTLSHDAIGPVWFAFSDVEWTKAVWERHKDAAYRARHMRKIDVAAWIKGANFPHAASVNDVAQHVAEYAEGVQEKAFKFSPIAFTRRKKQVDYTQLVELAEEAGIPLEDMPDFTNFEKPGTNTYAEGRALTKLQAHAAAKHRTNWLALIHKTLGNPASLLVSACERLDPRNALPAGRKGLILALDDPTGVITDLTALMPWLTDRFLRVNKKYSRKLAASVGIASLRQAVINQRSKVIAKNVELTAIAFRLEGLDPHGRLGDAFRDYVDVTAEAERLWETYYARYDSGHKKGQPRYDEAALAAFRQEYDQAVTQFDADVILPLARAHAAWMGSDTFLVNLETNYDTTDILSGEAYTTVVSTCIADTQDKVPCNDLYVRWLEDEGENPLKRAIGFNQDNVLAALAARAVEEPLIINVEEMEEEKADVPGKRLQRSTEPVIEGHARTEPAYEKGKFLKALSGYSSKPFSAWEKLYDARGRLIPENVSKDRVGLLMTQVLAPITRCVSKWAARAVQKLAPGVGRACAMADGVIFGVEFKTTLANQAADIRIWMTSGLGDENKTYRD